MSEVLKKGVVPKKTVRKTSVRAALVVPKKPTKAKPLTKKTTVKAPVLVEAKPKPKKRVIKKESVTEPVSTETVFVPSTASLRLLEKAELYRVWYKNNFPVTVAKVAQLGGYVFIIAGTLLASATYLMGHQVANYSAAVMCVEDVCSEVADSELPVSAPFITFNNSLPELLKTDTDIVVEVKNASEFKLYIKNLTTGVSLPLEYVEALEGNQYRYLISPQGLALSVYTLVAETKDDTANYKFSGPQFSVEPTNAPAAQLDEPLEVLEVATTTVAADVETQVLPESIETEDITDLEVAIEENETVVEEEASELILQSEDEEIVEEVPESEEVTATELATKKDITPITASIEGQKNTRYLKVHTGVLLPSEVAIYSQVESSEQPLYLGLATLVQGDWIFSLAAVQLPSANHLLYASFDVDGITYRSEGVAFNPSYDTLTASVVAGDTSILVQKIDLALLGNESTYPDRTAYFSNLSSSSAALFERGNEELIADGDLLDLLDEYMEVEQVAIDTLFAKYAHVSQVGKKYLLALSGQSAEAQVRALSALVAADINDKSVIPTLNTVLAERYDTLRQLIAENESRLSQDTSSLTSKDSDGDGISDYDELVSYTTNPSLADTDMDGVLDAVEIITGTNPLQSDVSMVVAAGSVVEDVVFDEAVSIDQVAPLIVRAQDKQTESVHALVFGKSVPGSYVYIVSPTLSTVGVIKTNDSGEFSYTLEKGVTDGRHEVFAVLTDASGTIVASSKPRVFTKSNNTFVAAAVGSQSVSFDSGDSKMILQFSTITTALLVVALGLVLLLLTHALRNRPKLTLREAK